MKVNNVELINKTILITGAAGFIGANLVQNLLQTVEGNLLKAQLLIKN